VTIIPDEQALSTVIQVPLSTSPHPTPGMLGGRTLSTLSLMQAKTVLTTGIGHQAAEPGQGNLTFYNAAPQVQTIPAGTLLVGKDGTEVVTYADAVIPGAVYPAFGQATVIAQTAITGPAGNIPANDIYGPCCRLNVSAVNSAFTGGQDARTFPMVTARDVANGEAVLRTRLMQSVQTAFKAELAPTEALITPIPCHESVESSSGIGQEATAVTIQLSETCGDSAYDTQALSVLVTHQLNRQVYHQLGTSYALVGSVTTTILAEKVAASGKLLLTVKGTGTCAYQFSLFQLQHLAQLVAGKSASEATSILLQQPGVSQVELGTSGTLPPNASRIHVLVVEQGM